jgi:hypothetical protein
MARRAKRRRCSTRVKAKISRPIRLSAIMRRQVRQ